MRKTSLERIDSVTKYSGEQCLEISTPWFGRLDPPPRRVGLEKLQTNQINLTDITLLTRSRGIVVLPRYLSLCQKVY